MSCRDAVRVTVKRLPAASCKSIRPTRSVPYRASDQPKLPLAYAGLSVAYEELNKSELAHEAIAKAQQLAAGATEHDGLHVQSRVAQMSAEAAPLDRAKLTAYRSAIDRALQVYPADAELWMLRGIAESADPSDRGQGSVASAIPYYDKALALGGLEAHHYLTHAYENTNQIEKAIEHGAAYAAMASAIPHALHMHGHVLRRAGQIDQAVAAFEAADRAEQAYLQAEQIPAAYEWHNEHNLDLLGSSYQYLGQMRKAEQPLKTAFALPSSLAVQMYDKRGWPEFLISRGRLDEALAASQVLIGHPVSLVRATGYLEAGHAQLAAGRFAAAAEQTNLALRELRQASGGQTLVAPALQQVQGEFFLRTGDRERGRTTLRELVRTARSLPGPDNWVQALFTIESIARAAQSAGDWEFADWAARQMVEHDGNYAGSHYALAVSAAHSGDQATASREYAAAARLWSHADADLPELGDARSRAR